MPCLAKSERKVKELYAVAVSGPSGSPVGSSQTVPAVPPRVLLHVGFSPLSFVGSFLWGIAVCCASVPGMLPTLFFIEAVRCVGFPLRPTRMRSI